MKALVVSAVLAMSVLSPLQAMAAKAYFAGGCFWCMEADFEKLPGVTEVISGFSGGTLANPTYNGDHRGHYETVEVEYDPNKVSYQQLLDHYWVNIDPFDARGQFCDKGHEYKAAIFPSNAEEKALAEKSKAKVAKEFAPKLVTVKIIEFDTFWPIKGKESYHQNFYKTHSTRYKLYRWNCGRDKRLKAIWGDRVTMK